MKSAIVPHLKVFFGFVLLSFVLRFFSFFPTVINHDESTYIVISDALLNGKTYWIDYIDTKPVGIFLIMAGFQFLFGSSIFVIRMLVALWVALTAFVLYRVKLDSGSSRKAGISTGVMYLFIISIFTFYGVSPNTETFFNLFTILGLWVFVRFPKQWIAGLGVGFFLGLGFMVKYVVLFDALAFGLFLAWDLLKRDSNKLAIIGKGVAMIVGFLIPFLLTRGFYAQMGELDTFNFLTFEISKRYPVNAIWYDYVVPYFDFSLRFLPITFFFYYALFHSKVPGRHKRLAVLWTILALTAILIPGKFYGHYFIQLMLPTCFLAGEVFHLDAADRPGWLNKLLRPIVGYPLLGVLMIANLFFQKHDYFDKPDYPKQIYEYIKPRLEEGETVYVSNYSQILYHLLDQECPIKYVHPSLFWEQKHIKALEVDVETELQKLKENPPRFVVLKDPLKSERLLNFITSNYEISTSFNKDILIYQRKKEN